MPSERRWRRELDAKGAQGLETAGAWACHIGAGEIARQRCFTDLGVQAAVVLLLGPGPGGLVEQIEAEGCFALEHGHQAAFDAAPELAPQFSKER